jgi:hypothetical protein
MGSGKGPHCTVVWTAGGTPASIDEIPDVATIVLPDLPADLHDDWVPRTAVALTTALREHDGEHPAPLVLVCTGPFAAFTPHLGFAQRAARRSVAGYVLINPVLPAPGAVSDWPDAPVHVVITPDAPATVLDVERAAHLRGWTVHTTDAATAVNTIVTSL